MLNTLNYPLFIGGFLALLYTVLIAYKYFNYEKGAKTFFFGSTPLSDKQISYSLFASWMSVGNVIVAALFITLSYGYFAIWAVVTWSIGFIILSRHAKHIVTAAGQYTTIHAFLRDRFNNPLVGKITSLLTLITASGVITLELMVGVAIFNSVVQENSILAMTFICTIVFAFITVIYTRMGGLSAVIRTDVVQAVAVFLSLIALLVLAYLGKPDNVTETISMVVMQQYATDPESHQILSLIGYFIGFGCLQLFILLGDMTTWQRIQLGASTQTVKKAAKKAALQNLLGWSVIFIAGLFLMD